MSNFKKIFLKILLFLIIIVVINYIYKFFFYKYDLLKHSPVITLITDEITNSTEIIYLGESSNITYSDKDSDKRKISNFINDYFPDLKLGDLTKHASHAGVYYELLRNIPENSNVKTVIVTLNMRSFDANWIYSNLETALQKEMVLLKDYPPLLKRIFLSFGFYDIKTDSEREKQFLEKWEKDILKFPYSFQYKNVTEWDKAMAIIGIKNSDSTINYPLTELACHYIKTYAFQIDTLKNPRIKDFDKIVKLAKKRNWNLIFNLMAENIERANELVGKDLLFLMYQNHDLLISRYNKNGVIVVDNFDDVPNSQFIDSTWTTEHYAEFGRKIIAKNVADSLKNFYPEFYKLPEYFNNENDTLK